MAGLSTLTIRPSKTRLLSQPLAQFEAIQFRLKHTEITADDGQAFNNYFPGMEFNHSATCSMVHTPQSCWLRCTITIPGQVDWYENKWYECANQTDAFIVSSEAVSRHMVCSTKLSCLHAVVKRRNSLIQAFIYLPWLPLCGSQCCWARCHGRGDSSDN
jgi:hypothetical protein